MRARSTCVRERQVRAAAPKNHTTPEANQSNSNSMLLAVLFNFDRSMSEDPHARRSVSNAPSAKHKNRCIARTQGETDTPCPAWTTNLPNVKGWDLKDKGGTGDCYTKERVHLSKQVEHACAFELRARATSASSKTQKSNNTRSKPEQ